MRVSLVNHELPEGRGILDLYNQIIFLLNGLGKNRFYRVIGPQNRYCANGTRPVKRKQKEGSPRGEGTEGKKVGPEGPGPEGPV